MGTLYKDYCSQLHYLIGRDRLDVSELQELVGRIGIYYPQVKEWLSYKTIMISSDLADVYTALNIPWSEYKSIIYKVEAKIDFKEQAKTFYSEFRSLAQQ